MYQGGGSQGHNRVLRILCGDGKFDEGRTREELENEMVKDEDLVEAEMEYERIWGVDGADEEVGEGGKRKGSEEKEENGRARKRRRLGQGES